MNWIEIAAYIAPWAGAAVSIAAGMRAHEEGARAAQVTISEMRRMLEEQHKQVIELQAKESECAGRLETLEHLYERQSVEIGVLRKRLVESERRAKRISEELAALIKDVSSGTYYESPRLLIERKNVRNDDDG